MCNKPFAAAAHPSLRSNSRPNSATMAAERRRHHVEVVNAKHAVDLATAQTYSENVFLFVPNLIGEQATQAQTLS